AGAATAASGESSHPRPIASWRQHEVVFDFPEFAGIAEFPRPYRIVHTLEAGKQALLHTEYRVGADVGIVGVEDMRDERLIAVRLQNEMQMRRGIGVSSQLAEQLSDRPIMGDWVVPWLHSAEPVAPVWPRAKPTTPAELPLD